MCSEQKEPILPEMQPELQKISQPEQQPTPKPVYSKTDTLYAWLCLLLAFLFCETLPVTTHPLGAFLLILSLFITGFVILRFKKQKLCFVSILSAVSSLLISSALLLTDTQFLIRLSFAYCLANYCYFLYVAFGNRVEEGFSDYIYIDYVKVLILLPFCSLGAIFRALFNKATEKSCRLLLKILAGAFLTFVPTVMVFFLLSYDAGFMKILNNIFSIDSFDGSRLTRSLIFSLPLGMYGFGLYISSANHVMQNKITPQSCSEKLQKIRILPQLTSVVAVAPLLFLYVVFFISQWDYYISGFTGVLPDNLSYAEYARHGFFELCSVSVINLLMMIAIAFFIKRKDGTSPVALKIIATIFCLCTLILISTAISKLVMYIDYYGLTQKRIYALWLMVLIGIVFLLVALGQYMQKLKVVAICFTIATVLFAGLSVCNVNALCAQYNADRFLSGSLETLDVSAMEELGDSAIPALVQVATSIDAEKDLALKQEIDRILHKKQTEFQSQKFSVFSFSLPSAKARSALRNYIPEVSVPEENTVS